MSLYQKYRPQVFADVVGQDHIVTTLEQADAQDKLAHAYLFAGGRGTGKTSVARILAKQIMKKGLKDEAIIQQIEKGVEEGNLVDLLEIDAASNRGIDDIRDLVEKIQFSPVVAGAKVYIIDEVHMLTKEAFNALLKTLEEPPAYAFFILATTELNKIPVTIQSRCQRFPFRNIRTEDIIRRLQFIVDNEKISVDRDALRAIANHVDGGMRDAISLLDQLRSLDNITVEDVEQRVGSTGHEYINTVFTAIQESDANTLVQTVKTIEENGIAIDIFIRQLLEVLRKNIYENVEAGTSVGPLVAMLDTLLDAIRDVRSAPVPGLVLESALLSLCATEESAAAPVIKVEEAKKETPSSAKASDGKEEKEVKNEKEPEEKADTPEQTKPATVEAAEVSLETVRAQWSDIVNEITPASIRMSLKDGYVQGVEGETVTVLFGSSFHLEKISDPEASRNIEKVMKNIFKKSLRLECTLGEAPQAATDESAVNLADAAAEIF